MQDDKISLEIHNPNNHNELTVEVWIDSNKLYDKNPEQGVNQIDCYIPEDESEHVLKFVLKNKLPHHTTVNEQGDIIADSVISFKNITFDEINVDSIVNTVAEYTHNFNGNGNTVTESFCQTMGCNGNVQISFSTPFYIWLLEHM